MSHGSEASQDRVTPAPDSTAVRTALWRAMRVEHDAAPHVFTDEVGLALVAPEDDGWRARPDMHPQWTRTFRAAMVARARFIEELVEREAARGVDQYVILGAGLDTFAHRRPELASRLQVFEVDRPAPQAWKAQRLRALGFEVPAWLHLVPVDFEAGASWWDELVRAGFDPARPAVVVSTGVTMYLSRDAIAATLRQVAALAAGSTLAMTFMLPVELLAPEDRQAFEWAQQGAAASGTPFATVLAPHDVLALARAAGFATATHVSGPSLADRYFAGRADGLRPSTGEDFLVATT